MAGSTMRLRRIFLIALLAVPMGGNTVDAPDSTKTIAGKYVIDVRSRGEWDRGHIEGALWIPHEQIADRILAVLPRRDAPIALYCGSGVRAGKALDTLKAMGYRDLENLGGLEDARRKLEPSAGESRRN